MSTDPFVSYAQNAEDVVLWRALGHLEHGSYVDVGAWHASIDSVTRAFYDRGWRGVNVEPMPELADELRAERPGDDVVEAAVTTSSDPELVLHSVIQPGSEDVTGLSTLAKDVAEGHQREGWEVRDVVVPTRSLTSICSAAVLGPEIHFLKIDVEGAEADVLLSLDLQEIRPWVLVVEATRPGSSEPSHEAWEPRLLDHDYELCLFDGLSRFYVAAEHPELRADLSYPACVFDHFITDRERDFRRRAEVAESEGARLWDDVVNWRALALDGWAASFGALADREAQVRRLQRRLKARNGDLRRLRQELSAIRASTSWRLTMPLRAARSGVGRRARPSDSGDTGGD